MKKFAKIIGFVFLFLIGLLIAIPFIFKGDIVDIVKEETNKNINATVHFGDFSLNLIRNFPNLRFGIEDIEVTGIDQFEGVTLAKINSLNVKVGLMSLINGEAIQIKSITIDEPIINAMVLSDSTANWDVTKPTETKGEEETEAAAFKLELQDLTISNGKITYIDATSDLSASLIGLNLNLSGDMTADLTALNTNTTIDTTTIKMGSIPYLKNARIALDAIIEADMVNNKYTFSKNVLQINELTLGADGWLSLLEEGYDMDIKYHAEKTAFKNILSLIPNMYTESFSDVKTSGTLALNGHAKGTYEEDKLPAFGINVSVEDATFQYPDLPKSANNIQMKLQVMSPGGNVDNTLIHLKRFYVEMAENPVDVSMKISTPVSDANIDGSIKGKIDLASLKEILPLDANENMQGNITADIKLKGKVSSIEQERYEEFDASGQLIVLDMNYKTDSIPYAVNIKKAYLNFSPRFVELTAFDSKIGASDMYATGKIENFIPYVFSDAAALKGNFDLNSSLMDLNEFMEEEGTDVDNNEEEPLEVIEIPKNIDFTINSAVRKVIYDSINIENLRGQIVIKEQKMRMEDVSMNLLGGSMVMNGFYETTNAKKPGMDFDMKIKNFDVNQTGRAFNSVEKLAPLVKKSTGSFDTELHINGYLNEAMEPILAELTGKGNLSTKSIQVKEVKALTLLATTLKNDKLKKVRVEDTEVHYEIKDGKVILEPFDIKMDNTTGTLSGYTTIEEEINYIMALKIPSQDLGAGNTLKSLSSQASGLGLDLSAAEFVNVDILIGGTFDSPTIKPSFRNTVGNVAEDIKKQVVTKAKEEVTKVKDDAKQKAKAEADRILKQAEVQADKIRKGGKDAANTIRKEGEKQAQTLIKQAGNNFLKKKAAEVAAKKVRTTANSKATKVEQEANKKADGVMNKARQQANNLLK